MTIEQVKKGDIIVMSSFYHESLIFTWWGLNSRSIPLVDYACKIHDGKISPLSFDESLAVRENRHPSFDFHYYDGHELRKANNLELFHYLKVAKHDGISFDWHQRRLRSRAELF